MKVDMNKIDAIGEILVLLLSAGIAVSILASAVWYGLVL